MPCPLTSVCVRLGLVPRILTRSFSSNPPSFALAELVVTPGTRVRESADILVGHLADILGTDDLFDAGRIPLRIQRLLTEARIPVTTISSTPPAEALCVGPWGASAAWELRPNKAIATAVPINVDLAILMSQLPLMLSVTEAHPRRVPSSRETCTFFMECYAGILYLGPVTCQYNTTRVEMLYRHRPLLGSTQFV